MKSVAEVLSDQNRALLRVIRETNPDSMAVLAKPLYLLQAPDALRIEGPVEAAA